MNIETTMSEPALFEEIRQTIDNMRAKAHAEAVILVDIGGQLMMESSVSSGGSATVLAALAASDYAATQRMAELLGLKREEFGITTHEGEKKTLHLMAVNEDILLLTVVSPKTPTGFVRLLARQATKKLSDVFSRPVEKRSESAGILSDRLSDGILQMLDQSVRSSEEDDPNIQSGG
jgi:predicted regulator of Ras-like GTPase activity (Roadblock/LC7/MglB family)